MGSDLKLLATFFVDMGATKNRIFFYPIWKGNRSTKPERQFSLRYLLSHRSTDLILDDQMPSDVFLYFDYPCDQSLTKTVAENTQVLKRRLF